jgi:iron complex transport system substrate-binding protein
MHARPCLTITLILASLVLAPLLSAQGGAAPSAKVYTPPNGAGFSIEYGSGYKLVTVANPWPGASRDYRYLLYPRGSARPSGIAADGSFETPLRRVATFSTTYIPQIAAIGEAASIVGVDAAGFVNTPEVRARIEAGTTVEVSKNWAPNVELLIALAPEAIFTYGMGNEWDTHPKLAEAGLPIVISGEWNERDPLARAQWIEFIAAFYDKEAEARRYVETVAAEYRSIASLAASARGRPSVLVNGPFQGAWSVSGGRSYMARFIADAGGSYLWADDGSTGGLTLSVEAVYERAIKADVWLNPGAGAGTLGELAKLDPRFSALPVVARGQVWNNDLRVSSGGGNDYFESAILNPHKVLADLVEIFHPGLLSRREFSYYRKLR